MKPAPLTEEEIKAWHKIQFHLTDDIIEDRLDDWNEWFEKQGKPENYRFSVSSASYSGHRYVTFLFARQEDAVLFRLFVGEDGRAGCVFEP